MGQRGLTGAFAGLRVLDVSQGLAGPYCGALFAQHGAEVVKVEPPEGDWGRFLGTRYGDHSALDLFVNRGKRSLAIDLRHADGRAALLRLADRADVVIESFRPGVAARLGIGQEAVLARNPSAVYVSISGFGQHGPAAARPGTDTVIQAYTGLMMLNRDASGRPNKVGFLVPDTVTGLYAFSAASTALYARRESGLGQYLDVSLMHGTAAFLAPKIIEFELEGGEPRAINAPAGSYPTRDGWIAITLSKEDHFTAIARVLGGDHLVSDPRYATFEARADHMATLRPALEAVLRTRDTAEWIARFTAADVLCNRIHTFDEWLADPQVVANGLAEPATIDGVGAFHSIRVPGVGASVDGWPEVGADGPAVLADAGFGVAEIAALVDAGVVVTSRR